MLSNLKAFFRKIFSNFLSKFLKKKLKIVYWKITGNYQSNRILGTREKYIELYNAAKLYTSSSIDNFISKNNLRIIDHEFLNKLALPTQVSIKKSKINYQHGKILYSLIDRYINLKKKELNEFNFIDIGTAKGFSSIVIAKSGIDNDINFNVYSYDIIPHNIKIFWNSISDLEGKKTRIELLNNFSDYMTNIHYINGDTQKTLMLYKKNRVNFAFVDGSHDYDDVMFEYQFIKQKQKKDDFILFDDVSPGRFNGVVAVVEKIKFQAEYNVQLLTSSSERGYAIATKKFD